MRGQHRFVASLAGISLALGAVIPAQPARADPTSSTAPVAGSPAAAEPRQPATSAASGQPVQHAAGAPGWHLKDPVVTGILGAFLALGAFGFVYLLRQRRHRSTPEPKPAERPSSQAYTPPGILEDVDGATSHQTYDITGKLTWVSRAPGEDSATVRTIVIRDDTISRDHALIQYRDHGYWVSDRDSANGTFVNDQRIRSERLLKHGDRLRFARFEFVFQLPQIEDLPETVFVASDGDKTRFGA